MPDENSPQTAPAVGHERTGSEAERFDDATHDEDYDDDRDRSCSWCCGDGTQDPDDPLWEGWEPIACKACCGTGLASKQTIW